MVSLCYLRFILVVSLCYLVLSSYYPLPCVIFIVSPYYYLLSLCYPIISCFVLSYYLQLSLLTLFCAVRRRRRKYAVGSRVYVFCPVADIKNKNNVNTFFAQVLACDNAKRIIEVQWFGDVSESGGDMKLLKKKLDGFDFSFYLAVFCIRIPL